MFSRKIKLHINHEVSSLIVCIILNLVICLVNLVFSFVSNSKSLLGDSIDAFGDVITYIIAIYAIHKIATGKNVDESFWLGIVQMILSCLILEEIIRDSFFTKETDVHFELMLYISLISLLVNLVCVILLYLTRKKDSNIKAA